MQRPSELWFKPWPRDPLAPYLCGSCWNGWVPGMLRVTRFHFDGSESETFLCEYPAVVPPVEEHDNCIVRYHFAMARCLCVRQEYERRVRAEATEADRKLRARKRVKGLLT